MGASKAAGADEFYTQLSDIERELKHYRKHFEGKVVYLNCDDPRVSNFFHYFSYNFEKLGIKKLIAACYKSQQVDLFSTGDSEQAIWLEYEGDKNGSGVPDLEEIGVNYFRGDGDFRSAESIDLIKQADIVVTNPPFSLFREYVAQLVEYGKQFLIVGNMNAVTYKEIWPLVKSDQIWLGVTRTGTGSMWFRVNDDAPVRTGQKIDDAGLRYQTIGNSAWFTNLDFPKRHEDLILYKTYNPDDYPTYGNYDGIEVSLTVDIPADYDGVMGVPITFLGKYNPDQFEIVGITRAWSGDAAKVYPQQVQVDPNGRRSIVTKLNDSAALRVATRPDDKTYYEVEGDLFLKTYARILIRRRNASRED